MECVHTENPGADDNASAISGLLELARVLNINKKTIPYKVLLVAYTLEEPPYFRTTQMGSFVHAKSLKNNSVNVKLMICLEMIGYFTDEENSQSYPIDIMKEMFPSKGNFIAIVGDQDAVDDVNEINIGMKKTNVPSEIVTVSRELPGADLSDHLNYWDMGYNAVMITDTAYLRNPHYHKASDTMETLNFEKMAKVVQGLIYYCVKTNKNYNVDEGIK